jgi:hypothetical protein
MAAVTPIVEETTGAVPLTVVVVGGVNIILALKRSFKVSKLDALRLFSIPFGFGNLANHA